MMDDFLSSHAPYKDVSNLVDYSCSYGWFVKSFKDKALKILGIDKDPIPIKIGQVAYGLEKSEIIEHELMVFLKNNTGQQESQQLLFHDFIFGLLP